MKCPIRLSDCRDKPGEDRQAEAWAKDIEEYPWQAVDVLLPPRLFLGRRHFFQLYSHAFQNYGAKEPPGRPVSAQGRATALQTVEWPF